MWGGGATLWNNIAKLIHIDLASHCCYHYLPEGTYRGFARNIEYVHLSSDNTSTSSHR